MDASATDAASGPCSFLNKTFALKGTINKFGPCPHVCRYF